MSEIGNLIYNRRKELGLTLEEVGNAVGVSKSTVKKWENGFISNMRRDKIEKLAKILEISPVRLLGIKERTISQTPVVTTPTDEDIKFALFDGTEGVTDEMYDEVKRFAKYIKEQNDAKNKETK